MKTDKFRRSQHVEDLRDPTKPVENKPEAFETINERIGLNNSDMAKDIGRDDVGRK